MARSRERFFLEPVQSIEPKNIDSQNRLKFHFGHCWENNYQKCKIFPRKGFGSKKKLTFWGIPGCPRVGPAPLAGSVVRENPPPKPRKSSFRQPWGGGGAESLGLGKGFLLAGPILSLQPEHCKCDPLRLYRRTAVHATKASAKLQLRNSMVFRQVHVQNEPPPGP